MAGRIYIPKQVRDDIKDRISFAVKSATEGYSSAEEDEDTLTGHLGASLITRSRIVEVTEDEIIGPWTWSMTYYKFRGRGMGATESVLGADGIFELSVNSGWRSEKKCLLFQAKKMWHNDSLLFGQAVKLSTWREAAFVVNFRPDVFEAFSLDEILRCAGKRNDNVISQKLDEVLGGNFPNCLIGDVGLRYNASQRELIWRTTTNEVVATRFHVKHRISVKVVAPAQDTTIEVDRIIPNSEVYLHRMNVSNFDVLSVPRDGDQKQIKKAYKSAAMTYHPDKVSSLGELERAIFTRRMQEINGAKDELLTKRQKSK